MQLHRLAGEQLLSVLSLHKNAAGWRSSPLNCLTDVVKHGGNLTDQIYLIV